LLLLLFFDIVQEVWDKAMRVAYYLKEQAKAIILAYEIRYSENARDHLKNFWKC
jgi:hypothetical protein